MTGANQYRPDYDPTICKQLPEYFKDGLSITQVCAWKLKIARSTYYEWKEKHPEFKLAAEMGEEISEAYHEKKLQEGADGLIDNFSAPARIFIMKSRFRTTYGEQKEEKTAGDSLLEKIVLGEVSIVSKK